METVLYIPNTPQVAPKPAPKVAREKTPDTIAETPRDSEIPARETKEKPVYVLEGCGFSWLKVFDDRVALVSQGFFFGSSDKTIPFSSITAVQVREAGIGRGHLHFTIPGGSDGQRGVMFSSDGEIFAGATGGSNTFEYTNGLFMEASKDDLALKIKNYIEKRIREIRARAKAVPAASLADELTKLTGLKKDGVLTEEEFQAAKKRLLNQ